LSFSLALECKSGKPEICTDKCLGNCDYVGKDPAICVTDPCKNCKTWWEDPSGKEVKCDPGKLAMPRADFTFLVSIDDISLGVIWITGLYHG
jgi:hypothetical protein